ncbi:barstar family protein [Marinobacter zhejiangensis]|nr:barstar family protein [Marinobacter zhejiangensis]
MNLPPGLIKISSSQFEDVQWKEYLSEVDEIVIDGKGIVSKENIIDAIRANFPLDPPVESYNWDAISDSLWEGMDSKYRDTVVVIKGGLDFLKRNDFESYKVVMDIFSDISGSSSKKVYWLFVDSD